ncbi:ATP-grasp domain-containing protein [Aquimarina muelleri]|uniref:ATP-grasp domain-containing protein n=1 Tax=Aquimarina muelleri TaxID=279356 RepID=UPI003F684D43
MSKIIALTDYKGNFGSKHEDIPYRSGMDQNKLTLYFKELQHDLVFVPFSEIDFTSKSYIDTFFIYTSSEDPNYYYKEFIEDIVYALQISGAIAIPHYNFLRANNNKVFMELLREIVLPKQFCKLTTYKFGTYEELLNHIDKISYPIVIKGSEGASGTSVFLSKNKQDLISKVKKVSKTFSAKEYFWELGRTYKHKGYKKDSMYRDKYILQEFIPNLQKDWKVLVFGKRYYILTRYARENDFRASGSKTNYKSGTKSELTDKILDFAKQIFEKLDIPHVSLDIAFDGEKYYLIEMQGLYFGTSIINMSDAYFVHNNEDWIPENNNIELEKVYADCISEHINQ